MAISITSGQEMKITIKSSGSDGNKSRTIRCINPLADKTTEAHVSGFAKQLMKSSTDSYLSTSGSIDLGILEEA